MDSCFHTQHENDLGMERGWSDMRLLAYRGTPCPVDRLLETFLPLWIYRFLSDLWLRVSV